jgi:hypothetical protein
VHYGDDGMRSVLPATLLLALLLAAPAHGSGAPGSPEYVARDNQNIADAYGRQTAPGGQLDNREYLPATRCPRGGRAYAAGAAP